MVRMPCIHVHIQLILKVVFLTRQALHILGNVKFGIPNISVVKYNNYRIGYVFRQILKWRG